MTSAGESLELIYNQFGIIQVLQRSPISQTSNWSGTFFCCFLQKTGSIVIAFSLTGNISSAISKDSDPIVPSTYSNQIVRNDRLFVLILNNYNDGHI